MSNYLDVMHNSSDHMRVISRRLARLGDAFYFTGNESMAETLSTLAGDIQALDRDISEAVSEQINQAHMQTQQTTGAMLSMAMSVVSGKDGANGT